MQAGPRKAYYKYTVTVIGGMVLSMLAPQELPLMHKLNRGDERQIRRRMRDSKHYSPSNRANSAIDGDHGTRSR